MVEPYLNGIEIQLLRDFVQLNFQSKTRLWRSVPALRPARRFIGEDSETIEFVTRHFISDGLQGSGVERARHSVTSISSTVKKRFEVHRRNRAVLFHSGLDMHQHRMATAMAVENFFARQSALHWPA